MCLIKLHIRNNIDAGVKDGRTINYTETFTFILQEAYIRDKIL